MRGGEGTMRYMSPELIRADGGNTTQSDVWAWGCLFLEVSFDQPTRNELSLATLGYVRQASMGGDWHEEHYGKSHGRRS